MRALGERLVAARPPRGLVVIAENDHYAGPASHHEEVAASLGAAVRHVAGAGHWWMIEKPVEAAEMLLAHWAR